MAARPARPATGLPGLPGRVARATLLLALCPLVLGFERTEARAPCAASDPLRRPFFGDTHVHTAFSFDAAALGVRSTPRDAYRFARGERVGLRPFNADGAPRRHARLARPLDFAVVTDHAGLLGETRICRTPGLEGYDSLVCRLHRRWPLLSYYVINSRAYNVSDPERYDFCGEDGAGCRDAALAPWREIRAAAAAHYDRSPDCRFTTFVGWEWSGMPGSDMIHRNVIFRNERVPERPVGYLEEPTPEGLWSRLEAECLEAGTGCDVLTIPHNSNLSGGRLFAPETSDGAPLDRVSAVRRAALEPLVEIVQHKGDSECRVDPLARGDVDELCAFEKLPFAKMDRKDLPFLWAEPPRLSYVREVLGEGLVQRERLGVNPFKLGIVGSTDTHEGTPGAAGERDFQGHAAGGDTNAVEVPPLPDSLHFNPGGLAVLWAEENSRDALFAAMRRREAYGTSGPRITVRFFGGWGYGEDLCEAPDFAARGYAGGVPMGGDLPPDADGSPVFAAWALRDPGTRARPSARLQRLQVVKLWLAGGEVHQRVFDVAGDPGNGAGVDPETCERTGPGADELCSVWRDPDFDPERPALWYVRVVENPSCRWSAWACSRLDPGERPEACADPRVPKTIQERAWTSPIWYAPAEAAARRGPEAGVSLPAGLQERPPVHAEGGR